MSENNLKKLKSGTDIRGVALDGVPGEKIELDTKTVKKISYGFLTWLKNHTKKNYSDLKIAIGHDSRVSADRLKNEFIETLIKFNVSIIDCGLSTTPSMFMAIMDLNCDASVEITASHHPFNKNGFKFFTKNGGLDSRDIDWILDFAEEFDENKLPREFNKINLSRVKKFNYMKIYSKRLKDLICKEVNSSDYYYPLKGLKIIVDAGNGAGGFFATEVLRPLGADISGSQFLNPNGYFPNHVPNPEDKTAINSIKEATIKNNADLGIIFDTDVDRVGAIDFSGEEINRNNLIAIASTIAFNGIKNATVVTDSVTSTGLKKYIEDELKGKQLRFKRGYKNVINEAIRLNKEGINCPLAIETSGHAAMRENYFLDDGAYLITKMIIMLVDLKKHSKTFKDIIEKVPQPQEVASYRLKISCENFKEYGDMIIKNFEEFSKNYYNWSIATDSHEGIKIDIKEKGGDSWVLIRTSVHDPILVINIESDLKGEILKIKNKLKLFINNFNYIEKLE